MMRIDDDVESSIGKTSFIDSLIVKLFLFFLVILFFPA